VRQRAGEKTPLFTRFSTVAGGAGSIDTPRDVRGFAVKFYANEGNKFPDLKGRVLVFKRFNRWNIQGARRGLFRWPQ
jgi:hypothetical protein